MCQIVLDVLTSQRQDAAVAAKAYMSVASVSKSVALYVLFVAHSHLFALIMLAATRKAAVVCQAAAVAVKAEECKESYGRAAAIY